MNGLGTSAVRIRYRYTRARALRRASNPAGATLALRTTTSGASIPFSPRWMRSGSSSATKDTTCPSAWTPASVRPATASRGAVLSIVARDSANTPWTVLRPGCRAQPRNREPS